MESCPAPGPSCFASPAPHSQAGPSGLSAALPCPEQPQPGTLLPPSFAHRGGRLAAHCQVQRIKLPSGKTRGSRSIINPQDLVCWPQCRFPGYLAPQLPMVSSSSDPHCDSQTGTRMFPAGSTHLRAPAAQVWPACPVWLWWSFLCSA